MSRRNEDPYVFYFAYDATSCGVGLREATRSEVYGDPVAVGKLTNFHWYGDKHGDVNICPIPAPIDRSRADNAAVLPNAPMKGVDDARDSRAASERIELIPQAPCSEVWGTLYYVPRSRLGGIDKAQGYSLARAGQRSSGSQALRAIRPYEQGDNDRNRWRLKIKVMKVLDSRAFHARGHSTSSITTVRAFVYLDEYNRGPGRLAVTLRSGLKESLVQLGNLGTQATMDWVIAQSKMWGVPTFAWGTQQVRQTDPDRQGDTSFRLPRQSSTRFNSPRRPAGESGWYGELREARRTRPGVSRRDSNRL